MLVLLLYVINLTYVESFTPQTPRFLIFASDLPCAHLVSACPLQRLADSWQGKSPPYCSGGQGAHPLTSNSPSVPIILSRKNACAGNVAAAFDKYSVALVSLCQLSKEV